MIGPSNILEKSRLLDRNGRYTEALELLSAEIRTAPDVSEYRLDRGAILADRLGRPADALEDFQRAIELTPESALPQQYLSLCYLQLGDFPSATHHARIARGLDLEDPTSHGLLARCHLQAGQFAAATECFQAALGLEPDCADYWAGLGAAFRGRELCKEAIEAYLQAIEIDPSATYYIGLASLQIDVGTPQLAIQALGAASKFVLTEGQQLLVKGYTEMAERLGHADE